MIVATVKEKNEDENRVSITPDTCKSFIKAGLNVIIEKNAGYNASFLDKVYRDSGAEVLERAEVLKKADILLSVSTIFENSDLEVLKNKSIIIGGFNPYENSNKIKKIIGKDLSLVSLDFLPRISRAQSMDILSSQANLAGYKAVIEASSIFKKALPMMMTAAGTIIPAKCLILGAGVAGLQAIATAKRLGCVVSAFDVRPEVEEQVNSLGAKFVKVENGANTKETQTVWESHNDEVHIVPDGFFITASSDSCDVQGMENDEGTRFGLQFHPEVNDSEFGKEMFENFVAVCRAAKNS